MVIISSYVEGETYGILGPQMAATIISDNTSYDCIVICITREDDKNLIKKALADYFGKERPIIGFSSLSGREDLFSFAKDLKDDGAMTIIAGPQADLDYLGETDWENHLHRFQGLSKCFTYSLHGPAEQAIEFLNGLDKKEWKTSSGLLFLGRNGKIIRNREKMWNEKFLRTVSWNNIYRISKAGILPLNIKTGQVLQQIGCPHASKGRWVEIDYPEPLKGRRGHKIKMFVKGCSFCDVATDKGFYGELEMDAVLSQIDSLPEDSEGRKIPFELINENPLFKLPRLIKETRERGTNLSQINLILRADWLLKGEGRLREALTIASERGLRILVSSIGFEAFDDFLLRNFNKGLNVDTNLSAVRLMRRLKEEYPNELGYSRTDGAIHGFIHPTPWDNKEIAINTQKNISIYGLGKDILPEHSTPLIIHHASMLGYWIREVEKREGVRYKRYGSIIGWWKEL